MKSRVAEEVREEQRQYVLGLTAEERVRLALSLGERCVLLYQEANFTTREVAIEVIREQRARGRRRGA